LLNHKIGWNKKPGYNVSNHTPSKVQQKMSKSWGNSEILQEIEFNQQLMSGDSCLMWLPMHSHLNNGAKKASKYCHLGSMAQSGLLTTMGVGCLPLK
jgi:hypothetical protein